MNPQAAFAAADFKSAAFTISPPRLSCWLSERLPRFRSSLRHVRIAPLVAGLAVLAAVGAAACRKAAAPAAPIELPKRWAELHLPTDGMLKLDPRTDEHTFAANYPGRSDAPLLAKVAEALQRAGYSRGCTLFDGHVLGFSKGDDQLVVNTIRLAPPLAPPEGLLILKIVDQKAPEANIHDVCFGSVRLGPPTKLYGGALEAYPVEPAGRSEQDRRQ